MPKAMVSIAVAQIAPGTIRQGVRLTDDDVPLSGYPGRRAGLRLRRIDSASAKAQTPPQFLRITAPKPHAHRNPNVGNPHPDAPAK